MSELKVSEEIILKGLVCHLIEKQKNATELYFQNIQTDLFCPLLKLLDRVSGTIVFSGIGKSGIIAKKIAATLNSFSIRSMFLCPISAMHGDLGLLCSQDVLIVFSKSGETDELLQMLPFVRKKGTLIVSIVSKENSRMKVMSDLEIVLPKGQELCSFDLAPTNSTVMQLLFGDCLAVALMQMKGFSQNAFALNHPAGLLGKKISLKVSDICLKMSDVPICKETDSIIDILHTLSSKKCGCILAVSEKNRLLGIFTDGDLRRAIEQFGSDVLKKPVGDFLTRHPLVVTESMLAAEALEIMENDEKKQVTVLPVIDRGSLVGLLRLHDLVQVGLFKTKNAPQ